MEIISQEFKNHSFTVKSLVFYLKDKVDSDDVLTDIWISGDVNNLRRSGAGHCYFTLDDDNYSIRCVMFKYSKGQSLLTDKTRFYVHGKISVYLTRGEIQLVVDIVYPHGVAQSLIMFEDLKNRLEQEGLFLSERKRSLKKFPQKIGVITSSQGAARYDIETVLQRRYPLVQVIFKFASVQGESAPLEIVDAFRFFNQINDIDVVILARGGGSVDDLSVFNEEIVVRSIFASKSPVVTGIGHDIDISLSDFVADHHASTPSAAAEIVVPDIMDLFDEINQYSLRIENVFSSDVNMLVDNIQFWAKRLSSRSVQIDDHKMLIADISENITKSLDYQMNIYLNKVEGIHNHINSLAPDKILKRGYSIVQKMSTGNIISLKSDVKEGDKINIIVSDGDIAAEVNRTS